MKAAVRSSVLVALMVLPPVVTQVQAGEAWFLEFEAAQGVAESSRKDLLIDFGGSDWCLPCRYLKERIISKTEFIEGASAYFVLLDIDLPHKNPTSIPADRRVRYERLQKRYGITSFPSVVLAMPDGRPYARTTYREALNTPTPFLQHLEPLRERGLRLRVALERAKVARGQARAEALADGLAEVDARFVPRFYAETVAALRAAAPADPTGYLAFLDGRRALDEFQAGLDVLGAAIDPKAVDALIVRFNLQGETLQEALMIRAAGEVLAGDDRRALATLAAVIGAQSSRTRFDHGDFIPLDIASIAVVQRRIVEAEADKSSGVGFYYALHRIFESEMPNRYELSCGAAFQPNARVRDVIGDRYGRALIRSTENLQGEARARALADGLDGTFFGADGSIREIVKDLLPKLVGKEQAKALLPGAFYPRWLN